MTAENHDAQLLGAYALGALEADESAMVEAHLPGCPPCREELAELRQLTDSLGELPPEALLDGPPEGGDLALQRTLRHIESEQAKSGRNRMLLMALAAAAAGAVLAGGGLAAGRALAPGDSAPPSQAAAGAVAAANEDLESGAAATVMLRPDGDGLQLESFITGIAEGEECEVVVVGSDGGTEVAATWTVSAEAAAAGSTPSGTVGIEPQDVSSVLVRNLDDDEFVAIDF